MATIGDPLCDFAYHCMPYYMPNTNTPPLQGLQGADFDSMGIPSLDEYMARYVELTGFDLSHWNTYMAYVFFRIAGIL